MHGEVEHLGNVQSLVAHLESFVVVALALAHVAGNVHVGQKVHFNPDLPVAAASLATPAAHVKTEPPRFVAAFAGVLGHGKDIAYFVKNLGIGGRV